MNWSEKQTEFWNRGYTVLENLLDPNAVTYWAEITDSIVHSSLDKEGVKFVEKEYGASDSIARDGKGKYKLFSIDGGRVLADYSGLRHLYRGMIPFLQLFTGLPVTTSKDSKSAVTVMYYPSTGGQMLPHYDTNGLTFLLYLTDNEDGGTEVYPLDKRRPTILGESDEIIGEPEIVLPRVGRVVLMQGRRVWHRAMPVNGKPKISSAWNYYTEGDFWRPEEVSRRLY